MLMHDINQHGCAEIKDGGRQRKYRELTAFFFMDENGGHLLVFLENLWLLWFAETTEFLS